MKTTEKSFGNSQRTVEHSAHRRRAKLSVFCLLSDELPCGRHFLILSVQEPFLKPGQHCRVMPGLSFVTFFQESGSDVIWANSEETTAKDLFFKSGQTWA